VFLIGLLSFLAYFLVHQSDQTPKLYGSQKPVAKAAIIDHLSISWANPAFVKETAGILKRAGYHVDYYGGEQVTVEFYRNLPTLGYHVIVLRAHTAYIHKYLSLSIFTSEPYSRQKYVYEQLRNRVASGYIQPYQKGDPQYFVITDKFVRFSMKGSFDDTLVLLMGCTGIKKCAATAFLDKGARACVGWDGLVSAGHTDKATLQLLKHLVAEKQTIIDAVTGTMKEVGQEPEYKSTLLFWPIKAGNYTVQGSENSIEKVAGK
jgi:hypothetical protein